MLPITASTQNATANAVNTRSQLCCRRTACRMCSSLKDVVSFASFDFITVLLPGAAKRAFGVMNSGTNCAGRLPGHERDLVVTHLFHKPQQERFPMFRGKTCQLLLYCFHVDCAVHLRRFLLDLRFLIGIERIHACLSELAAYLRAGNPKEPRAKRCAVVQL